jgi:hypothetical protein
MGSLPSPYPFTKNSPKIPTLRSLPKIFTPIDPPTPNANYGSTVTELLHVTRSNLHALLNF